MSTIKGNFPPKIAGFGFPDLVATILLFSFFAGMLTMASHWFDPLNYPKQISMNYSSLPLACFMSLTRITSAYLLSLCFSICIGYWAAHSKSAEKVLIPMIDILQSIPVLGFLPGFVLTLLAIFPNSRIGLEISAILMIFTGMAWNMTLGFYAQLKSIPENYKNLIRIYGYGKLGTLFRLELPYAMNSLVWNSMLSVAGGWFFLTICESFSMGEKSFQLIGLGSYMYSAAQIGDTKAILAGMFIMISLLVLSDRIIWKPLLNWAERFQKNIESEDDDEELSNVLDFFSKSKYITRFLRRFRHRYAAIFYQPKKQVKKNKAYSNFWKSSLYVPLVVLMLFCILGMVYILRASLEIAISDWIFILQGALWSFLRVFFVLVFCCCTMIPLGLWLGSRPRLTRRLQPLIQIAAAFPAPMIFPILISITLFLNIPMSIGSIFLMMFGAQWYVLFNVLSGASAVPREYVELARTSGMNYLQTLYRVYLPACFPQIVTGLLTAAGGAWNTSIVAEFVYFRGKEYYSHGLGSYIAKAAASEQFAELLAAVFLMVSLIIFVNRFVWAKLYLIANNKYNPEMT